MSLVPDVGIVQERTPAARLMREIRLYLGKTQGEMPDALGMAEHGLSVSTYSKLENNRGNLPARLENHYLVYSAQALIAHCDKQTAIYLDADQ
jgi:transcriptional regulator with XRE-family HTH domain